MGLLVEHDMVGRCRSLAELCRIAERWIGTSPGPQLLNLATQSVGPVSEAVGLAGTAPTDRIQWQADYDGRSLQRLLAFLSDAGAGLPVVTTIRDRRQFGVTRLWSAEPPFRIGIDLPATDPAAGIDAIATLVRAAGVALPPELIRTWRKRAGHDEASVDMTSGALRISAGYMRAYSTVGLSLAGPDLPLFVGLMPAAARLMNGHVLQVHCFIRRPEVDRIRKLLGLRFRRARYEFGALVPYPAIKRFILRHPRAMTQVQLSGRLRVPMRMDVAGRRIWGLYVQGRDEDFMKQLAAGMKPKRRGGR